MTKVSLVSSALFITAISVISCGGSSINESKTTNNQSSSEVSDSNETASSNKVTIGNQVWMAENLNVDKFRNGDPIPEAKTTNEWIIAGNNKQPAWCYYRDNPANGAKYGRLYNWYAVDDPRGLAPNGWHVPADGEWKVLAYYLRGVVADKMNGTGKQYGRSPNADAKESSFLGLKGGSRDFDGAFEGIGGSGYWWSSTEISNSNAWAHYLYSYSSDVTRHSTPKIYGFSVRCLRD